MMRDVTEFQQLQEERNKVSMMKMLNQTVSHDIISPMDNIVLFANKMLESVQGKNFESLEMFHRLITEQAKLVSSRVKDLLDQGLIDHGTFVPNQVKFVPNQRVSQVVSILKNILTHGDVSVLERFDPRLDQSFMGDADRIQQVLLNLVSNARKYVPKNGGKIQIETELIETNEDKIIKINVIDNGPGISDEDKHKLFKPFSKLSANSDLNPYGNGLGLNICKMICKSLGGDINVTSVEHIRTVFSFWVKIQSG